MEAEVGTAPEMVTEVGMAPEMVTDREVGTALETVMEAEVGTALETVMEAEVGMAPGMAGDRDAERGVVLPLMIMSVSPMESEMILH